MKSLNTVNGICTCLSFTLSTIVFGGSLRDNSFVSSFIHSPTYTRKTTFQFSLSVSSDNQTSKCQNEGDSIWDLNTKVFDDTWIKNDIEKGMEANDILLDEPVVGPTNVLIYDTTLRDGTQGESVSVSCDDKLKIASRLASFGVDFIECGWPGSNPKDAEFFSRAQNELGPVTKSKLVAFGSTRRKNINACDDSQVQALLESEAPTVCIVAKGHLWQVTDIIRASPEENINMITDTVKYLTEKGRRVFVDLEHFFDGYKYDSAYSMKCCDAAVQAGAKGLVLCDTNGGSMPWDVEEVTKHVTKHFGGKNGVTIGIHAHNDCGLAVANSLSSVRGGSGMVQGTINGIGERTGNADLCSIIPSLSLHVSSQVSCGSNLKYITKLSRFVDEILNRSHNSAAPFVGVSAFAHKGGLHVAAMQRSPLSYQHVDPVLVGNEMRVLISELSGRQNIMGKIEEMGVQFGDNKSERATRILNRVKNLESIGYTFEGADASVRLMILHASEDYCPPFRLLDYSVQVFESNMDFHSRVLWKEEDGENDANFRKGPTARATIKVSTLDDEGEIRERLDVSDGNGPVDALASALKRSLSPTYDLLNNVELVDYKVRILDPENATGANTRVMVEFRDPIEGNSWTTVSVDTNVISASLNALIDGFEYALLTRQDKEMCLLWESKSQ